MITLHFPKARLPEDLASSQDKATFTTSGRRESTGSERPGVRGCADGAHAQVQLHGLWQEQRLWGRAALPREAQFPLRWLRPSREGQAGVGPPPPPRWKGLGPDVLTAKQPVLGGNWPLCPVIASTALTRAARVLPCPRGCWEGGGAPTGTQQALPALHACTLTGLPSGSGTRAAAQS